MAGQSSWLIIFLERCGRRNPRLRWRGLVGHLLLFELGLGYSGGSLFWSIRLYWRLFVWGIFRRIFLFVLIFCWSWNFSTDWNRRFRFPLVAHVGTLLAFTYSLRLLQGALILWRLRLPFLRRIPSRWALTLLFWLLSILFLRYLALIKIIGIFLFLLVHHMLWIHTWLRHVHILVLILDSVICLKLLHLGHLGELHDLSLEVCDLVVHVKGVDSPVGHLWHLRNVLHWVLHHGHLHAERIHVHDLWGLHILIWLSRLRGRSHKLRLLILEKLFSLSWINHLSIGHSWICFVDGSLELRVHSLIHLLNIWNLWLLLGRQILIVLSHFLAARGHVFFGGWGLAVSRVLDLGSSSFLEELLTWSDGEGSGWVSVVHCS